MDADERAERVDRADRVERRDDDDLIEMLSSSRPMLLPLSHAGQVRMTFQPRPKTAFLAT